MDGISTVRAIVEHVKPLAKLAQSRDVLLHVDDWTTKTHRQEALYPGATYDFAYLKEICREFKPQEFLRNSHWLMVIPSWKQSNRFGRKGVILSL